jgi:hypothetical protein
VVYDLAKNPSFVHREPIVKVGLDAGLERDAHPVMDKPEVAHEGRHWFLRFIGLGVGTVRFPDGQDSWFELCDH